MCVYHHPTFIASLLKQEIWEALENTELLGRGGGIFIDESLTIMISSTKYHNICYDSISRALVLYYVSFSFGIYLVVLKLPKEAEHFCNGQFCKYTELVGCFDFKNFICGYANVKDWCSFWKYKKIGRIFGKMKHQKICSQFMSEDIG